MADKEQREASVPDDTAPAQCRQCGAWHHGDGSVSATTDRNAVDQVQDTMRQWGGAGTMTPDESEGAAAQAGGGKSGVGSLPEYLAPVVLKYPNGEPVIDPLTKAPYPLPASLDMHKNIAFGKSINGDFTAGPELLWQVGSGQAMDYQRPLGLSGVRHKTPGWFVPQYTNVTAYNVGVVGASAGFDLQTVLGNSGRYNRMFGNAKNATTPYGLSEERVKSITQGYNDYARGKWADAAPH